MRKTSPVPEGHPRRMSDAKNAWRKMTDEQRVRFLCWLDQEEDCGLIEDIHTTDYAKQVWNHLIRMKIG